MALVGVIVLAFFAFMAAFAPIVSWHGRDIIDLDNQRSPPSTSHILGTDYVGRDIYTRVSYAGRVSLSVGVVAAAVSSVIATLIGLLSGYVGRWVDNLLMRFTELVMTFRCSLP